MVGHPVMKLPMCIDRARLMYINRVAAYTDGGIICILNCSRFGYTGGEIIKEGGEEGGS